MNIMKSIAITKIMIAPQLTPLRGAGLPPRGDILNYLTDFYEIWYILSLTIMESIAVTKIMVAPQLTPQGGWVPPSPLGGIF